MTPIAGPEAEGRIESMAGAIYGNIVIAGLMTATEADDDPYVWPTAAQVMATVIVFWLAHAYALSLAHRAAGSTEARGLREQLHHTLPLVESAVPPLGVMLLARLLGADDTDAIEIGSWVCVLALGGWGLVVARRERESRRGVIATTLGCAGLGFVMIVLKTIIH